MTTILSSTLHKKYDAVTGHKFINQYKMLNEIGRGVHGKVKLAQQGDSLVAIKIIDKHSKRRQYSLLRSSSDDPLRDHERSLRREMMILRKCHHPNIIQLLEIIDDPQSRKIYMVLEYTEGGAITWRDEHDRPVLTKKESKQMFKDIVNGLDYLHGLGIIHRDIKPANLLLTKDQRVKITDFGTSYDPSQDDPKLLMETVGTPAFFAPELCRHSTIPPTYSMDVWALGVTLYCFTFGKCPFMASTEFELFELIPTHPLSFPSSHDDPVLEELLLRLLTKDPISRITLQQVKMHPWISESSSSLPSPPLSTRSIPKPSLSTRLRIAMSRWMLRRKSTTTTTTTTTTKKSKTPPFSRLRPLSCFSDISV